MSDAPHRTHASASGGLACLQAGQANIGGLGAASGRSLGGRDLSRSVGHPTTRVKAEPWGRDRPFGRASIVGRRTPGLSCAPWHVPTESPVKSSLALVCTLLCAALVLVAACGGTTAPAVSSSAAPAVASAAPSATPVADGPPRLVVISAINGYVEPCGCTVDLTLGGIDRIATRIAEERRAGPTAVLMVGSVLFDPHVDDAHLADQEAAKAEVLARALSRIGVDATVTTHTELKYGPKVLDPLRKAWPIPDVTVNVAGGAPRMVTLGALKVGVFGVVDAASGPTPAGTPTDPEPAVRAAVQKLRADGAQVVVGLAALPRKALRTLAKSVEGVDLWALGDTPNEELRSQPVGKAYVLEAGDRGRNLGRVLLLDAATPGPLADPAGDRARELKALELQLKMREDVFLRTHEPTLTAVIAEMKTRLELLASSPLPAAGKRFEYTLVPVPKDVVPEPEIAGWLAGYNARLKEINLAASAPVPPVPEGGSGYAGGKSCIDCHEEAQQVWLTTPHSKAWKTLVDANKTFDAECVSCHVTGWLMPGGVNLKNLDGRTDIQCESCHGPGQRHVDVGGDDVTTRRTVPEAVCVVCHNHFHSPKFDYATYLPRVLGPGHAQKN
jgi:hypothetical protein